MRECERPSFTWRERALFDLRAFADSDMVCAEVDTHGRFADGVQTIYSKVCREHTDSFKGIRVTSRGGHVYIIREVPR